MLKLNDYAGRDEGLSSEQTAAIFAKRYRLGFWCVVIPFFGFFSAAFLAYHFRSIEFFLFALG